MITKESAGSRRDELLDDLRTYFKVLWRGAAKCLLATTIVVPAHAADVDLTLGGLLRTYPLSGVVEGELGYGLPLWGPPRGAYAGYVRPRLYGSSAVSYNSLDAALEVFPLGFLGARAGGEGVQNDARYTSYDCEAYRCLGRYYRTYFEAELSLGAGPVFAQARWRRERWTARDWEPVAFVDPTSGLAMAPDGDSQTVLYGIVGLNVSAKWAAMAVLRYAESAERQISRTPTLMVRYRGGSWTVGAGGGVFESTLKKLEATGQFFLRWEIWPSLALR